MSGEMRFIREEVVAEIKNKARGDMAFKKTLFDNPEEALSQFGFVIPGSSGDGKNYQETLYAMFARADFYIWFNTAILSEFREEKGPVLTASEHADMDWDFEVTNYKNNPG